MALERSIALRQAMRNVFPPGYLEALARSTGAVRRLRRVKPVELFWTLVLGFTPGRERTLAGLRRSYQKATGQCIEESSFYYRFSGGLVKMLKEATAYALRQSLGVGRALRGKLAGFADVVLIDSTVVRLHDLLAKAFPGSRTNHSKAALKAHAIMSVTGAGKQSIKVTSGRAHDCPVLQVGPWVRGRLLLFDMGYFRYQLFACITRNGGFFVSRLKSHANPRIVSVNRTHRGRTAPVVGEHLRTVVGRLQRDVLDVMVEVDFSRRTYAGRARGARQILRVIGIRDEHSGDYHLYLTNVPVGKLAAEDIRATYALRWEIELLFKELKHHYRFDDVPSSKKVVVEALLHAAILTLVVSRRLLALMRKALPTLSDRLPARRWAAIFQTVADELLLIVVCRPNELGPLTRRVCRTLFEEAVDPNKARLHLLNAVETGTHQYKRQTYSSRQYYCNNAA